MTEDRSSEETAIEYADIKDEEPEDSPVDQDVGGALPDPEDAHRPPGYRFPGLDDRSLVEILSSTGPSGEQPLVEELELRHAYQIALASLETRRELPSWADAHELSETGWGVVFAHDADEALRQQLLPLLERRRDQAGQRRYKEMTFDRSHDAAATFLLDRCNETPGVIDPDVVPYYLLLVGGPDGLPFDLQYHLGVSHAVGRIAFDDVADYRRYGDAVVRAETFGSELPRGMGLFCVENDWATRLLARHLVDPLVEKWDEIAPGWKLEQRRAGEASHESLKQFFGQRPPGILLISAHGKEYPRRDVDQRFFQGAIVCRDRSFNADHVAEHADLDGQLSFLFACHGAGTPRWDDFPDDPQGRRQIAEEPFVAQLPQKLLARGALAVVGHVDRGWTLSFAWKKKGREVPAARSLEDSLRQLLRGARLGHAMRPLQRRATALAAELVQAMGRHGPRPPSGSGDPLVVKWRAYNDARNFVVLGDPAVYALGRRERMPGHGQAGAEEASH